MQIAKFSPEGFTLSRLFPYENWEKFHNEAIRLWRVYSQLAKPVEVLRLGLRYVNRIPVVAERTLLEDVLQVAPQPPRGLELPFDTFLYHDTFLVPGHPYAVNVVRTVQRAGPSGCNG